MDNKTCKMNLTKKEKTKMSNDYLSLKTIVNQDLSITFEYSFNKQNPITKGFDTIKSSVTFSRNSEKRMNNWIENISKQYTIIYL